MTTTAKVRSAREALSRMLGVTLKTLAAREFLERKFHSGLANGARCFALVDLLRFLCAENPLPVLKQLSGFRTVQSTWIKPVATAKCQGYARAHWFQRKTSEMKFCVESERREGWLAPYAITMFGDDRTGLLQDEVMAILEQSPQMKLVLCELALDFSSLTFVDRDYVCRFVLFGKSRRDISGLNQYGDWWGSKRGPKRVKSYFKDQIAGHRVEFRMRSRFLRTYDIHDVFDLPKLLKILPRKHIFFARLDEARAFHLLRNAGLSMKDSRQIISQVRAVEGFGKSATTWRRYQPGFAVHQHQSEFARVSPSSAEL